MLSEKQYGLWTYENRAMVTLCLGGGVAALDAQALFYLAPFAMRDLHITNTQGAPATIETMLHMRSMLPADALWAGFGIGPAQFQMVASAVLLGGNVRVGLEDNLYVQRGVLASSNAVLVERAVQIVECLGARVASKQESRNILGIGAPSPIPAASPSG